MNDDPIRLRPATPEDEEFLFRLYAASRAEEVAAWGWTENARNAFLVMQFRARQGGYRAAFPDAEDRIAERGGLAIGRFLVDRSADRLVLVDVALVPEERGAGIGTRLVSELLEEARRSGRPVHLQVELANPARRLYERLGFEESETDGLRVRMTWKREQG